MDDGVLTQLISFIKIDDHSIKSRFLSYTYFVFKWAASAAVQYILMKYKFENTYFN